MKIGVCYYPEHWPEERWASDAAHMRKLGISVVRVAEFAWSRLENANGEYSFEWLHRAINTCLLYTSPSPRDLSTSRMPSSA